MSNEDNCENCGSSDLKQFKHRDGVGCWDCGNVSDNESLKLACSDCESFVEDGSCMCGKTQSVKSGYTESGEKCKTSDNMPDHQPESDCCSQCDSILEERDRGE